MKLQIFNPHSILLATHKKTKCRNLTILTFFPPSILAIEKLPNHFCNSNVPCVDFTHPQLISLLIQEKKKTQMTNFTEIPNPLAY